MNQLLGIIMLAQVTATPAVWTLIDPQGRTIRGIEEASCEKMLMLAPAAAYCMNQETGDIVRLPAPPPNK